MPRSTSAAATKDLKCKVVLLGEQFVGKTSIFLRLKDNEFPVNRVISTGTDIFTKVYNINGQQISLVIQDTAGVERFRSLTNSYYRDVAACVLVFSIDNQTSFDSLPRWKEDADHFLTRPVVKFVVGNKTDLDYSRCVPAARVNKLTSEFSDIDDTPYYTSAKTGEGVEEVFQTIATKLVNQQQHTEQHHYLSSSSSKSGSVVGDARISGNNLNKAALAEGHGADSGKPCSC